MNNEIWEKIKSCPNYSVSNLGNVRNDKSNRVLKNILAVQNPYYRVSLVDYNKRRVIKRVHRLMAEVFICNPDDLPFVDYIDRNKLNNNLGNLRWVTKQENLRNRSKSKNNTSGYIGVSRHGNKFRAQINENKIMIHIGTCSTPEEAAIAYNLKAIRLGYTPLNIVI
jgi:hypothetical protein